MQEYWIAVILGIIEGLTEFLPVSSTGHLILTAHVLGFTGDKAETFEIVIQLGAILAVAMLYWRRLFRLIGLAPDIHTAIPHKRLSLVHVVIAITPAMLLGFLLHGFIKHYLFTPHTVIIGLVIGGVFMIYAEKLQPIIQAKTIDDLTHRQALKIGLAQCLSLWPGFSRAGATIAGGLLSGASLRASADFSFLIAVPMMIAASGYDVYKSMDQFTKDDIAFFAIGFTVSFIVALLAVVTFLKLLEKVKLRTFAYYRFIVAGLFWLYIT